MSVLGAAALLGVVVGVAGTGLVCLLHLVQHAAYGYEVGQLLDRESFLQGASAASPIRRVVALVICGFAAGGGWWAIERFGKPLVKVEDAVRSEHPRLPIRTTIAHATLQIVTVGLGSPLGRELAPREVGAMAAAWFSERTGFSGDQRRLLVACAAGAGLAAVYNVPFGGALFTLEVLLGSFSPSAIGPAVLCSTLAALVVKVALHNPLVYRLDPFAVHAPLLVWCLLAGPVLGIAAVAFGRLAQAGRAHAPHGPALLAWCLPVFLGIGLLATVHPELLGNGKSATQVGLAGEATARLAAVLLILRFVVTVGSLRAGAKGGLLTPSIALGALLATALGAGFNHLWPDTPLRAFATVGATAFLAASQQMPITAIVLMAEFARVDHDMLFAMMLAVAGAAAVASALARSEAGAR